MNSIYFKLLLYLSPIVIPIFGFSQAKLTGEILDQNQEPVPFSNVLLLHPNDSTLYKGAASDVEGKYSILGISEGVYLVSVSVVGYETYTSQKIIISKDMVLPAIYLQQSFEQLDEIIVQAQKPLFEQKIDKLVVNVQSDILASGSSVLDVLERSPGISVDKQNNRLSMSGKDGVIVMVNGKTSRISSEAFMQMLSGMSADNVDKIEIITTPSSNHDAEGNAGIINLITKVQEDLGTSGNVTLSIGKGKFRKPAFAFNFTHRINKAMFYGDYSILSDHLWQEGKNLRNVVFNEVSTLTDAIADRRAYRISQHARAGMEFQIDPSTTMGLNFSGFSYNWKMNSLNNVQILNNGILDKTIGVQNKETNLSEFVTLNFNLSRSFGKNHQFILDLDRLFYKNFNPSDYLFKHTLINDDLVKEDYLEANKKTPVNLWVGKLDYVYDVSENSKFEAGLKWNQSRLDNRVSISNFSENGSAIDSSSTENHSLNEKIMAAYVGYHLNLGAKTKIQAGLRWEITNTNLSSKEEQGIVDKEYGNFFPSIFLLQDLTKHSSLQASYSRRITRPSFTDLAPFIIFVDPNTFWSGNTALQPAFTDALQLGYRFKENFMLTLQYSHDRDRIVPWQAKIDPESNSQLTFPDNIKDANNLSVSVNAPFVVNDWWQMQNYVQVVYQSTNTEFEGVDISKRGTYGTFSSNHTFTLPLGVTMDVSGFFETPKHWGFGTQRSLASVNAGLQKAVGNHSKIRLSVTDIFWTMRYSFYYDQPEINLNQDFKMLFEPRVFKLSYSWNFGNKKVKSASIRKTSEEELRRIGN